MEEAVSELHEKAAYFYGKHKDEELRDYLLSLSRLIEDAEMLRHQFAYFLMHTQSTIATPSRPKHFQAAIDRAHRFLKKLEGGES
jgi:hypothetical protein